MTSCAWAMTSSIIPSLSIFSIFEDMGGWQPCIYSLRRKRFRVACVQTSPISFVATKGIRRRLHAGKFPCSLGAKNEERESKTTQKMAQVKERGGSSCFISRAAKTENPVPRSFFTPKPNGNACYAGYHASDTRKVWHSLDLTVRCVHSDPSPRMQYFFYQLMW